MALTLVVEADDLGKLGVTSDGTAEVIVHWPTSFSHTGNLSRRI
jgi:hypothetical protein